MKKLVSALATLLLALAAGCSKESKAAASSFTQDLSKLSMDDLKAEGTKIIGDVTAKLANIKDAASAETIAKELEPMVEYLGRLKDKLAAGFDLSSLSTAVDTLKAKFTGDTMVMEKLEPLLEKLRNLSN